MQPTPDSFPCKLIVHYTDGSTNEEFFRAAPHDYALELSRVTTVDSACVEAPGAAGTERHEYRDGSPIT